MEGRNEGSCAADGGPGSGPSKAGVALFAVPFFSAFSVFVLFSVLCHIGPDFSSYSLSFFSLSLAPRSRQVCINTERKKSQNTHSPCHDDSAQVSFPALPYYCTFLQAPLLDL